MFDRSGWEEVRPQPPRWWLHRAAVIAEEHEFTTAEIFPQFSTLVASNRDHLVVHFERGTVLQNVAAVQRFSGSNEPPAEKFQITLKSRWNVDSARTPLRALTNPETYLLPTAD